MARTFWTKEQKAEFWSAFVIHRDAGCSKKEAYRLACADIKAIGKAVPGLATFAHWYDKAMHAVRGPMDDAADGADSADSANNKPNRPDRTYKENAGTEAAEREAGEAEGTAEESAPDPDYTHRLELMVRLYRTRSEAAVDAVCDRLLPELAGEE